MEDPNFMQEKNLRKKVQLRKIAGWIMVGFGVFELISFAFALFWSLIGILFFGVLLAPLITLLGPFLLFIFLVTLIGGSIAIVISILVILAGRNMVNGERKIFVSIIIFLISLSAAFYLISTIGALISSGSSEALGGFLGSIIPVGISGFFVYALRESWDTFISTEEKKRLSEEETGRSSQRGIEKERVIYTKEYSKELEEERRMVRSAHERYVPADGYDFSSISK
jgi:hypothetical protein